MAFALFTICHDMCPEWTELTGTYRVLICLVQADGFGQSCNCSWPVCDGHLSHCQPVKYKQALLNNSCLLQGQLVGLAKSVLHVYALYSYTAYDTLLPVSCNSFVHQHLYRHA